MNVIRQCKPRQRGNNRAWVKCGCGREWTVRLTKLAEGKTPCRRCAHRAKGTVDQISQEK